MDFLVEFDIQIPDDASRSEVEERERGEAAAAARLAREGHLVRIWKRPVALGRITVFSPVLITRIPQADSA